MTITIPSWILWTLGLAGGAVVLGLAVLGGLLLWSLMTHKGGFFG